jgi:hypothetical protein
MYRRDIKRTVQKQLKKCPGWKLERKTKENMRPDLT